MRMRRSVPRQPSVKDCQTATRTATQDPGQVIAAINEWL